MSNETARRDSDNYLDLNKTDFFIDDLAKLKEYREGLITAVSSLKSQLAKEEMRLQYNILKDDEEEAVPDLLWIKKTHFSLSKATMFYEAVCRKIEALESGGCCKN